MPLAFSDITREVDRAFMLIGGVSIALLLGITIAMVILAVRFRRGRAKTTVQIEGHKWLEVVWIGLPTVIVTWMFFVGYRGFALMRQVPEDAMVVEVTGRQWMWSFHYPTKKIDTTEMAVPVGTPVKVELTAPPNDVIHSFYIPDFRVKEDALPGRKTHLWFEAERVGTYNIFCAEFCGKGHSGMITMLKVMPRREFDEWVKAQQLRKYLPLVFEAVIDPRHETFGKDGLNIDPRALYQTFCLSCHGADGDGSGLPGQARDFTSAERWKLSPKVTDIYRTLTDGIKDTQMRAYPNFAPWERMALAHQVRSFLKDEPPADTREDYAALVKQYGLDKVQKPQDTIPIERAMEIMSKEAAASEIGRTKTTPG
jgi:cytochrome c oxidase subunit II